jgi:uncharacterized membrane protein YGL010W
VTPADEWLIEYGRYHNDEANCLIHWICIPLLVLSLVGLLWSIPVPETFSRSTPALNWGTIFLMASIVYYFIMSISLAVGSLPFIVAVVFSVNWLEQLDQPLWLISTAIFLAAWAGQRVGHQIEGNAPSMISDMQYLMIGPVWMLAALYRRLGIRY